MTTMNKRNGVSYIRKRILRLDEWVGFNLNHQCAEMTERRRRLFVGLGFRAIKAGRAAKTRWRWETVNIRDERLESGVVASRPAAKAAAEASAKRILLAA